LEKLSYNTNQMKKKSKFKKILKNCGRWLIIVFLVAIIGFLGWKNLKSFYNYNESQKNKEALEEQILELRKKKAELQEKLRDVETEENLEEIARQELSLKKEGEEVFAVLSPEENNENLATDIEKESFWSKIKNFINNNLASLNPF